jgi:hypothetical protein
MKKTFFLLVVLLFIPLMTTYAAEESPQEYNPFLAGTLSWYSAGLGQIYTENYAKGILFLGIDTALLLLTIDSIADFNLNVDQQFGINFNLRLKNRQAVTDNTLTATFFLVTYITFHFYNVLDAVASASKKNLALTMNLGTEGKGLQLALSRRF